ncbi:DUF397 domain-containing protein [Streptomyces sp. NPDC101118]|uniref:DUF397 domain-containing protein n=1 Tax=Streptomyces sp. NPDC101118 TaxID=3366109 RepID=UPI003824E77A
MNEPLSWQKSSYCAQGEACVYVAHGPTGTRVAQRADGGGPVVAVDSGAWAAFIQAVRAADLQSSRKP